MCQIDDVRLFGEKRNFPVWRADNGNQRTLQRARRAADDVNAQARQQTIETACVGEGNSNPAKRDLWKYVAAPPAATRSSQLLARDTKDEGKRVQTCHKLYWLIR